MTCVFGDTAYFLALINPSDELHQEARRFSMQPSGPLLTTEFILMEVGDGLSQPANRRRFQRFLELLRAQGDVEILEASSRLFELGCDMYASRPDKEWSLTYCTSFAVISEREIEEALSSDHHFAQAV